MISPALALERTCLTERERVSHDAPEEHLVDGEPGGGGRGQHDAAERGGARHAVHVRQQGDPGVAQYHSHDLGGREGEND